MENDNGIRGIFERRNKAFLYLIYVYGFESLKDPMETKHFCSLCMNFTQVHPNIHRELTWRNLYDGADKTVYFSTKKAKF